MGSNGRAIYEVELPVDLSQDVGFPLEFGKDLIPDALLPPPVEAVGDGRPGAVSLRQIPPRSTGTQDPEDAIHHSTKILARSASIRFLGWEQLR